MKMTTAEIKEATVGQIHLLPAALILRANNMFSALSAHCVTRISRNIIRILLPREIKELQNYSLLV
jgi:hypothetical protein